MADYFNALRGVNAHGVELFFGSFDSNSTSSVDQSTIQGNGVASVTYVSTGIFDVVLDRPAQSVLYMRAEVEDTGSPSGLWATVKLGTTADHAVVDPAKAPQSNPLVLRIQCRALADGTAAAPASGQRIMFMLALKRSTV